MTGVISVACSEIFISMFSYICHKIENIQNIQYVQWPFRVKGCSFSEYTKQTKYIGLAVHENQRHKLRNKGFNMPFFNNYTFDMDFFTATGGIEHTTGVYMSNKKSLSTLAFSLTTTACLDKLLETGTVPALSGRYCLDMP